MVTRKQPVDHVTGVQDTITPQNFVIGEWSSAFDLSSNANTTWPVSSKCCRALDLLFSSHDYEDISALSIAAEASSHPSGLISLRSQPWVYGGGGLGNGLECLSINADKHRRVDFHNCIAGAAENRAASLPFASICIPSDCTASDLASDEMLPLLQQHLTVVQNSKWEQQFQGFRNEYVTILEQIRTINEFLGTGWVCGEFQVPWNPVAVIPFFLVCICLAMFVAHATCKRYITRVKLTPRPKSELTRLLTKNEGFWNGSNIVETESDGEHNHGSDKKQGTGTISCYKATSNEYTNRTSTPSTDSDCSLDSAKVKDEELFLDLMSPNLHNYFEWRWIHAFDLKANIARLAAAPDNRTTCLDGLRVGSLMWILMGHVMAIESSTGAGYSNPAAFLPPNGWTATMTGQLLFSSRLAVDTFFCISGFLLVHILDRKITWEKQNWLKLFCGTIPFLIISRIARILPVYVFCLWFYMNVAPHLGGGPFWYQWQGLLFPCQGGKWVRNLLFSNNLIDGPITETCFYHSWYLAVDMQLYVTFLLLLLSLYNFDPHRYNKHRRILIFVLFIASVCWTVYFSWTRRWSINTFDGVAVVRYDAEGYASPMVRAQSYLAGMMVASCSNMSGNDNQIITSIRRLNGSILGALSVMSFVVFVTCAGAYSQRPCQYDEWPKHGRCGSTWSPILTFLYTAFSRTIWNIGLCIVLYACVIGSHSDHERSIVASILSWKMWTPLSNLSFGAYLIHPIVIFIWQLGGRQKAIFSLLSFSMTNFSIAVTSFVASFIVAILVEVPIANFWRKLVS